MLLWPSLSPSSSGCAAQNRSPSNCARASVTISLIASAAVSGSQGTDRSGTWRDCSIFALIRRNAGRADQPAPSIDLAPEKSAGVREGPHIGLVAEPAQAFIDAGLGDDPIHGHVQLGADVVGRAGRRQDADPAVDAEARHGMPSSSRVGTFASAAARRG